MMELTFENGRLWFGALASGRDAAPELSAR
jgi:hypothetical protein